MKRKLTALSEIRDKAGNTHRKGERFEVDEQEAQELIKTGQARQEETGETAGAQQTSRK